MKKVIGTSLALVAGIANIINGITAKNWIDLIAGFLILGGGGAYASSKNKNQANLSSTKLTQTESAPQGSENSPDISQSFYNRFLLLTIKTKILSIALIFLILIAIGVTLQYRSSNEAKSAIAVNVAKEHLLNSLIGKTPTEINLVACTQAYQSVDKNTRGGSKGKTVGDTIIIFNSISADMTEISKYAVTDLKIPIANLAVTAHEAALSLDKDTTAQNVAAYVFTAAVQDLTSACSSIGYKN